MVRVLIKRNIMVTIYVNKKEEAALNVLINFCVRNITHTDNDKDIYHVQQLSQNIQISRFGSKLVG